MQTVRLGLAFGGSTLVSVHGHEIEPPGLPVCQSTWEVPTLEDPFRW